MVELFWGIIYVIGLLSLISYAIRRDSSKQDRISKFKNNILLEIKEKGKISNADIEILCYSHSINEVTKEDVLNKLVYTSIISMHVDDNGCIYYTRIGGMR